MPTTSPLKHWLGRLVLLALITPSTIMLIGLAAMSLGMAMIAESGSQSTSETEQLGGGLMLIGLGALWVMTLTGSGRAFPPWVRWMLGLAMVAGFPGGILMPTRTTGEETSSFSSVLPQCSLQSFTGFGCSSLSLRPTEGQCNYGFPLGSHPARTD